MMIRVIEYIETYDNDRTKYTEKNDIWLNPANIIFVKQLDNGKTWIGMNGSSPIMSTTPVDVVIELMQKDL